MVSVEQAVKAALSALPRFLGGTTPPGTRVEEVTPGDGDEGCWRVTLSYLEPGAEEPEHPALQAVRTFQVPPRPERVLRVLTIDASGNALSMTLRTPP